MYRNVAVELQKGSCAISNLIWNTHSNSNCTISWHIKPEHMDLQISSNSILISFRMTSFAFGSTTTGFELKTSIHIL